jgi:hypothetical protein
MEVNNMSLELEKIYTVKEVAEYGRCTPQYIYKLIKRKKVKVSFIWRL